MYPNYMNIGYYNPYGQETYLDYPQFEEEYHYPVTLDERQFGPMGPPQGPPPGFPTGPSGSPPPFAPPGGQGQQAGTPSAPPPTSPPPSFVPAQTQQASAFAVDPGSIRRCLFRFTYVWQRNQQFWFYPTFVGRRSVAGYRWTGFRWVYFGIDLRQIQSFTCV